MTFTNITLEKRDLIGTLTLNRPEKLNAMTPGLIAEMGEALTAIEQDPEIKVVIVRGAGRAFCTGYDLTVGLSDSRGERYTLDDDQRSLQRYVEHWLRLRDLPKPVISMVHGYCLAGGSQLAICTDIIFVAENASIGFPSIPAGAGYVSSFWNWMVGPHRTKYLAFLPGSRISGKEAEAMGFATRAFPPRALKKRPTITRAGLPKFRPRSFVWKSSQSTARWICKDSGLRYLLAPSSTRFSISAGAMKRFARYKKNAGCAARFSGTRRNSRAR